MKSLTTLMQAATSVSCSSLTAEEYCRSKCDFLNKSEGHANEIDGVDCPLCLNRGYISVPREYDGMWETVMKRCSCSPMRQTVRELQKNGLERVVDDYTLAKYICATEWQTTVKNTAECYLHDAGQPWFYFGGASGCGKSHICTAIAVELLRRGQRLKYMIWRSEATQIKQIVNDQSEYHSRLKELTEVDVLYIDDLFKTGKASGQAKQVPTIADINLAFEIINARYLKRKRTIISSESSLSDLISIDEATAGRIKQMCGAYVLNATGNDKNYRLKGGVN